MVLLGLVSVGAVAVVAARRRPGLRAAVETDGRDGGSAIQIDPFGVSEPWRQFVQHALHARDQFRVTLRGARRGPLRAQLEDIGESLDGGMARAWATAQHGHRLSQARGRIDTDRLTADLNQQPADGVGGGAPDGRGGQLPGQPTGAMANPSATDGDAIRESLQAQLDSAYRLDQIIANAEQQLRLLTTQLDEAATRAGELAVRAGTGDALEAVAADITRASDQLEALRLAMEETDRL